MTFPASHTSPPRGKPVTSHLRRVRFCGAITLALLAAPLTPANATDAPTIAPSTMARLGTIDPRFQSYNIEMVEITGGRFWRPYRSKAEETSTESNTPDGIDARLFQYRPPIDLTNPRLRMLAAALGPAYVRISGTWANTTFFADQDEAPALAPAGFGSVLTRPQWRNVVDFAQAVDAGI